MAALKSITSDTKYIVGGTIPFVADYFRRRVVMNVLESSIINKGGDPVYWMYPTK